MADVTMPKLSDTMEEGKLLRWLKQAGERVEAGEVLAEVETDKADMELEASASGVLREIKLAEGSAAPVGAVIAVIDEAGGARAAAGDATTEAPRAAEKSAARAGEPPARAAEPAPEPPPPSATVPRPARAPGEREAIPAPRPAAGDGARHAAAAAPARDGSRRAGGSVKVSPLAVTVAEELGVDLQSVTGSGPGGRITRADVEAARRAANGEDGARAAAPAPAASPAASEAANGAAGKGVRSAPTGPPDRPGSSGVVRVRPPATARAGAAGAPSPTAAAGAHTRRVPLSRMRASIARRMAESKREAPHFYLTTIVDMEQAAALRASLKELAGEDGSVTFNHLVLKACADALAAVPEVNARFAGDAIEMLEEVNLGVATAVDDGLIVPVIHGADRLSLLELAARARELAERAKSNGFSGNDLSGSTFSVSNLGMYGVESFSAVINPPHAGILAVGSIEQRAVVRNGQLAARHTVALTLSCDHRAVDGVQGGRFLAEVKRRLENPVALLLGPGKG